MGTFLMVIFRAAVAVLLGLLAFWMFEAVIPESWAMVGGLVLATAEFFAPMGTAHRFDGVGGGARFAIRFFAPVLAWPATARALEFAPIIESAKWTGLRSAAGLLVAAALALALAGGHGSGKDNSRHWPLLAAGLALVLAGLVAGRDVYVAVMVAPGLVFAALVLVYGMTIAAEVRDRLLLAVAAAGAAGSAAALLAFWLGR